MRIIAAVLLFVASGISAVSAQQASWSMDHGHAADAADAATAAKAAADAAKAKAAASPGRSADFIVNGSNVIRAAPPKTPEQQKADAEARDAWQARCRPTVIEDRDGLRRTRYAEPDCDLSRFNTAGTQ